MIGSLFWKEWREHCWKMVACLMVLCAPIVYTFVWPYFHNRRADWALAFDLILLVSWAMAIWIAAWTLTGERRTQHVLEALPVPWWKIFGVKIVLGLATLLLPMACVLAFVLEEGPGWPVAETFPRVAACVGMGHLYLLIVATCMGVRREGMAAMQGVLVSLVSILGGAVLLELSSDNLALARILFPLFTLHTRPYSDNPMGAHLVECAIFCAIAAFRYRRLSGGVATARGVAVEGVPGTMRLRTRGFPVGPLAWKEWREQRGVLLGGALAGFGFAGVIALTESHNGSSNLWRVEQSVVDALRYMGVIVPLIMAIVLGISGWTSDLDPGIETFWRSRPISAARVFWIKYAIGIAGTLLLGGLFLGSAQLMVLKARADGNSYLSRDQLVTASDIMKLTMLWCPLAFTGTVLLKLLVRQPIYAGVLSVGATMSVAAVALNEVAHLISVVFVVTICAITVGCAVLASKCLQRNWRFA